MKRSDELAYSVMIWGCMTAEGPAKLMCQVQEQKFWNMSRKSRTFFLTSSADLGKDDFLFQQNLASRYTSQSQWRILFHPAVYTHAGGCGKLSWFQSTLEDLWRINNEGYSIQILFVCAIDELFVCLLMILHWIQVLFCAVDPEIAKTKRTCIQYIASSWLLPASGGSCVPVRVSRIISICL